MKKIYLITTLIVIAYSSFASSNIYTNENSSEVRFIKNNKRLPDEVYQKQLREQTSWKNFIASHGTWYVTFNEENAKPHRAFGKPIATSGADAQARALNFITSQLTDFGVPITDLVFKSAPKSSKHEVAHFSQKYNGLDILFSSVMIKMALNTHEVLTFGLDCYNDITISTTPTLSMDDAKIAAKLGVTGTIENVTVMPALKILPIPSDKKNNYKLVYEVNVESTQDNMPAKFYTLVDANTGEVLYRTDRVDHFANVDLNVSGTIYPTNPYGASPAPYPMSYIKVTANGVDNFADVNGYVGLTNTSSVSSIIPLEGKYAKMVTGPSGTVSPTISPTLNLGNNNVSFGSTATIRHLSAYYHTNIAHDFMKTWPVFQNFASLDIPLKVRIDRTDGTCNAFFDGQATNFYTTAGGCFALSLASDVVYHEYGHAISNYYYQDNGTIFENGGLGEGYSDVWGLSITKNPILGIGFSNTDPNGFVRRYDINKKVYPQDIVGEVHADGEIICGAWYDTYLNLGFTSWTLVDQIFTDSWVDLPNGPNGTEGMVYTDVLIAALNADDNDNDITNGTPNDVAITNAFALHGITLLSNAYVVHDQIRTSAAAVSIPTLVSVSLFYPWALANASIFYKINNSATWNQVTMTPNFITASDIDYNADIPAQPAGTIIPYYIALVTTTGVQSPVLPKGASLISEPHLPYYILVGYNKVITEDFEDSGVNWIIDPDVLDDASTGMWEIGAPVGSYVNTSDTNSIVQTGRDHTINGYYCAVTQNASGTTTAFSTYDIDNGHTTLESPSFDLTPYNNPAISYYRWYSNEKGANPRNDNFNIRISNDGGLNWVQVERTNIPDEDWKQYAFKVSDYVTPSANVKVRFYASDSTIIGLNLDGGSIVEAAVDDFEIYEVDITSSIHKTELNTLSLSTFPNPAKDELVVYFETKNPEPTTVSINNNLGQSIFSQKINSPLTGKNKLKINLNEMPAGVYQLQVLSASAKQSKKISIVK